MRCLSSVEIAGPARLIVAGSSSGGIGARRRQPLGARRASRTCMLRITPTTDNPPATMVISIGSDSGFSRCGSGRHGARHDLRWRSGRRSRRLRRPDCLGSGSVAGAGALTPGLADDVGSGQRIAAAGAITLVSLCRRRLVCRRRRRRCGEAVRRCACCGAARPARRLFARTRRAHRRASVAPAASCATAQRRLFRCHCGFLGRLARGLFDVALEIPALASGAAFEAVAPMAAGRRLRAGRGQAFVGRLLGVSSGAARQIALDRMAAAIADTNFAARVFMLISGDGTQRFTRTRSR